VIKNNFKPLGSVLQAVVKKHHLEDEYYLSMILQKWDEIVDSRITKIAQPVKLEGAGLTLKVETKAWQEEIKKYSQEIIESINKISDEFEIKYLNII
jgi:predicted nucleic acid-binding Zn ribbon protein